MQDAALESIGELLAVVIEVVAMAGLTLLGVLAEHSGISRLDAGLDPLTIWYVGVGAIALYAGVYMLGYRRLRPRVRASALED